MLMAFLLDGNLCGDVGPSGCWSFAGRAQQRLQLNATKGPWTPQSPTEVPASQAAEKRKISSKVPVKQALGWDVKLFTKHQDL